MKSLRTGANFTWKDDTGTPIWSRSDAYGYDIIDQLTTANYGAGATTWDYDAAGNRISDSSNPGTWTYDNLNRMSSSPGFSYTNDILGNRLTRGSTTYDWDILNRMTGYTASGNTTNYTYRPDGLRATKVNNSENTSYYYDGQMAIEEQSVRGATTDVKCYGVGARGLDIIEITRNGSPHDVQFPMYDGHGNQVGTLRRDGANFTISNLRAYDAWGTVNYENFLDADQQTRPKEKYCGNLGHKADDESSLIYMRARYYEPSTGRFISEDDEREGRNWYGYCHNNPINAIDATGTLPTRGNVVNGLWWLSIINGMVALGNNVAALRRFVGAMRLAEDSADIENAWAAFMKDFNRSITSIDDSGNLGRGLAFIRAGLSVIDGMGRSSSVAGVFMTFLSGISLGSQFAILGFAYNLRIAWYIDDID